MPDEQRKGNIFYHAKFNLTSLLRLAERMRRRPCFCDETQRPMEGALNWTILLQFNDDTEWIFRSPKTKYAVNNDTAYQLLASEAATLKYIREKTHIPVPEVFSYW